MAVEEVLDLDDGHVLAAADDDVPGAAGDADIAVGVHPRVVAGVEPEVLVHLAGVRPVEVTHEQGRPPRLEASLGAGRNAVAGIVHDADRLVRYGAPVRVEDLFLRVAGKGRGDDPVLGHAPGAHDIEVGMRAGRLAQQDPGDRRAGAEKEAKARDVELSHRGVVHEIAQERGRGHRDRAPFVLDELRCNPRVPDVLHHALHAARQRHDAGVHEPGLVRERRTHVHDVALVHPEQLPCQPHLGQQGVGGVHDALGLSGRAGGVHQLGDVVGAGAKRRETAIDIDPAFPRHFQEELFETRFGVLAPNDQHVLEVRQVGTDAVDHRGVVDAAERARHDDQLRLREAEHEAQLALAEDRHQGVEDRADPGAGRVEHEIVPPAGQLPGHDLAAPDPQLGEAQRHPVGQPLQLSERQGFSLPAGGLVADHGDIAGPRGRDPVEMIDDQLVAPEAGGGQLPPPALRDDRFNRHRARRPG